MPRKQRIHRISAALTALLIALNMLLLVPVQTLAAESVSIDTIQALMHEIPKYYQSYCTAESAAVLDACIQQLSAADLTEYSAAELVQIYDALSLSIEQLTYISAELPQIYITTDEECGETMVKETGYVDAQIVIVDTDGSVCEDSVQIKVRGNSTARVLKRSYTFKFPKKRNLLGLGKGKKWALLANCLDPTMIRSYTAFEIAKELKIEYASSHCFTEVWVDGNFKGFYELIEPVQEGSDRVDIDIERNGGMKDFLIQYEALMYDEGKCYFLADDFRFKLMEPEDVTEEQLRYVQSVTAEIVQTIKRMDYAEISTVIDTESFAKLYLLNEYLKNVDFDYSSVFFYYKDGIFYAGPPWDFDLSAGNQSETESEKYRRALQTSGLFANSQFFAYLCQCEEFMEEVRQLYAAHYAFFAQIHTEGGLLDRIIQEHAAAIERNRQKAGWFPGTGYYLARVPDETYEENVEYLRNWLRERNTWLTTYFDVFSILLIGDLDENGEVQPVDAVVLKDYLLSARKLTEAQLLVADINQDGTVNASDLSLLKQILMQDLPNS